MTETLTRQPIVRKLRHASPQDLAAVLETHKRQTVDLLVPASNIRVTDGLLQVAAQEPILRADGVLDINGQYRMTTNADGQLAEKFGVPIKYHRRLHDEFLSLYDTTVNEWANHSQYADKKFLVRMLWGENANDPEVTGIVRAFMSAKYAATDSFDIFMAALDGMREGGLKADQVEIKGDLSDDKLYVVVNAPEIQGYGWKLLEGYRSPYANGSGTGHGGADAENLPIISAGIIITNSETGNGATKFTPRLTVRACGNGLQQTQDALSSIHLGGVLSEGVIEWSSETRKASIELARNQAKDAVKSFLNATYVQKVIDKLEAEADVPVTDVSKTIEVVTQEMGYTEEESKSLLNFFVQGGQATAGGILQATTAMVQQIEDADRAYTIEAGALQAMAVAIKTNLVTA